MNRLRVISLPLSMRKRRESELQPSRWAHDLFRRQSTDFALIHIWRLALSIEGNHAGIEEWFRCTPIGELGGLTAQQLVAQGDAPEVIDFLWSIRRGERG
jgi:hypothetical protein